MVSQKERDRLVEMYKDEPLFAAGTVIKCAACLLILTGLAVIGTSGDQTEGPVLQAQSSNSTREAGTAPQYVPIRLSSDKSLGRSEHLPDARRTVPAQITQP